MTAFFEIHDSVLRQMSRSEHGFTLRLQAIRHELASPEMEDGHDVFTQEIELELEGATIENKPPPMPMWLLDGFFRAEHHDGKAEDEGTGCIPATLKRAEGFRLRLEGMNEDNQEYGSIEIHGESMKLVALSEPKFLEKFPYQSG